MATDTEEELKKCHSELYLPQEVKVKYFPQYANKFSYDVLPLFEVNDYNKKIMHEVSIIENPIYGNKWKAFMNDMPRSAWELKPVIVNSNKVPIFANYRRQKVPPEYLTAFIGPPTPETIFRRTK